MRRPRSLSWLVGLLAAIHGIALFAGFFAPYSYREQNRDAPLAPPTPIGFVDSGEGWRLGVVVAARVEGSAEGGAPRFVPLRLFVRGASYSMLGLFEWDRHLFGVDMPHRVFLLGTDELGRDQFSRLVYGGQVSLTAGLISTVLALSLALLLGGLAGYRGGFLDQALMRATDVFLSLPWIYMLLAARAFLPLDMEPERAFLVLVALLGLLGWAAPTRIVRGIVLSAKEREFVEAARSAGAGHLYVLWRHVLPQTRRTVATQAALMVPAYMLAEVTLSFVGLGVGQPRPSWGNMLADLPRTSLLRPEPWVFAPALCLIAVTWLYHSVLSSLRSGRVSGAQGRPG